MQNSDTRDTRGEQPTKPADGSGKQPAKDTGNGMMNHSIRLSRLNHPRGTLVAMALLAAVFLLFGVFAHALHPELATQAPGATSDAISFLTSLC